MAKKRKKRQTKKRSVSQPSRKVVKALDEAMELFEDGHYNEAQTRLVQLAERYPSNRPVLTALLEVCHALKDWSSFARYNEQLLALEQGSDRAVTLNNLIGAYMKLLYPALAWQTAQDLISQHPDFPDIETIKDLAQSTGKFLREQSAELMPTADLALDEKIEVIVQHDRVRFYTESGQPEKAIATAEAVLEKAPNLVAIFNNLSLSYFATGNIDRAIAVAEEVLAQRPDNFHALANLTRYSFLTAQFDAAHQYADRLQQVSDDNPDLEVKQAEALSFLGDDEGIRQAYQRAKERRDDLSPLLLHLAAAANYRLGDEKTAWRLWRQAVERQPSFSLAQENLDDKALPVGERDAPWFWPMPYWFPPGFLQSLNQLAAGSGRMKSNKAVETAVRAMLDEYPYLPQLLPHILERGDRGTREFVLNFTRIAETPELVRVLYDFALSPHGADNLRMEALHFIREHHPELLPEEGQVPMWIRGQQTEIFMLSFEIYEEPEMPADLADDVLDKHEQAYELLIEGETKEAEQLLQEVIAAAPDFASAYNQLAVAYERQGRRKEARALVEETHARFPDYFFARIALARIYALENRIEEARDLVDPVIRLKRLHISEFRALAQAQMQIALADKQEEAARAWLNMWLDIEDDHPELLQWRQRLEAPKVLLRNLQQLLSRSRR